NKVLCAQSRLLLDNAQLLRGRGNNLRHSRGNNQGVFNAHATFTWNVNTRLNSQRHIFFQMSLAGYRSLRAFVDMQANAMTGGVDRVFTVAGISSDLTACPGDGGQASDRVR